MLKGNNIIKIAMKNFLFTLTAFMFTVFIVQQSHAEKHVYDEEVKTIKSTAAGCPAGAGFAFLDINNVRVRINTGGDMWWNFDRGQYFIPANTQKTSMFSASLWIGGLDVNGQLIPANWC